MSLFAGGQQSAQGGPDIESAATVVVGAVLTMIALAVFGFLIPIILMSVAVLWLLSVIALTGEDGVKTCSRFSWSFIVLVVLWTTVFGFPFLPPEQNPYAGILFRHFPDFVGDAVSHVLLFVNQFLPEKKEVQFLTATGIRSYFFMPILIGAIAAAGLLRSGRLEKARNNPLGRWLVAGANYLLRPYLGSKAADDLRPRASFRIAALCGPFIVCIGGRLMAPSSVHWLFELGIVLTGLVAFSIPWALFAAPSLDQLGADDDRVLVGHFIRRKSGSLKLSILQFIHHIHIVGASGFGKSVLLQLFIRYRILRGHGLFYIDLKADFETIQKIIGYCQQVGRTDDLLVFNCSHPELSVPYNVVARGDATELHDRIMSSLEWSEAFYRDQCSDLLLKVLTGMVCARELGKLNFHLGDVLEGIQSPDYLLAIKKLIPDQGQFDQVHQALAQADAYLRNADLSKNLQGLRSQLGRILMTQFGPLLTNNSPDGIDIFRAAREKKIIIIFLNSRRYTESAPALGKIIIQDLKAASDKLEDEIPKKDLLPFGVVVDEFADLAQESFIQFQDRARSTGMGVVIAHQEFADLKRISPEFPVRINHLSGTTFAFLTKGPDASEAIASTAGTRLARKDTERVSRALLGIEVRTGEKSVRDVEEFNIHPNDLKQLKVGECVVIGKYPAPYSGILKVVRPDALAVSREEAIATLTRLRARFLPPEVNCRSAQMENDLIETSADSSSLRTRTEDASVGVTF